MKILVLPPYTPERGTWLGMPGTRVFLPNGVELRQVLKMKPSKMGGYKVTFIADVEVIKDAPTKPDR